MCIANEYLLANGDYVIEIRETFILILVTEYIGSCPSALTNLRRRALLYHFSPRYIILQCTTTRIILL